VYADTSVLLTLYFPEELSSRANAYMAGQTEPLLLGAVQEAELRNASRQRVAQRRSSPEEVFRGLAFFDRDVSDGLYVHCDLKWKEVFKLLERISQKYTERGAHRFSDLLHIACAMELEARVFLSFDQRQAALAKALGMKTPF